MHWIHHSRSRMRKKSWNIFTISTYLIYEKYICCIKSGNRAWKRMFTLHCCSVVSNKIVKWHVHSKNCFTFFRFVLFYFFFLIQNFERVHLFSFLWCASRAPSHSSNARKFRFQSLSLLCSFLVCMAKSSALSWHRVSRRPSTREWMKEKIYLSRIVVSR